jgi:hypothetical protein
MSAIAQRRTAIAAALFVLLYLLQVVVLMAPPARADLPDTLSITMDGDTTGSSDWDEAVAAGDHNADVTTDICSNQEDDVRVVASTKLNDPWPTEVGNVVGKGDLCRVWSAWDQLPDGDVIFYFAWERRMVNGEVSVYVPLDGTPFGSRDGDVLIKFEYDSKTGAIEVSTLDWDGAAWSNETQLLVNENADAEISESTDFGEAVINLTDSGILSNETCASLVGATMISETGQADGNPTLKDIVTLDRRIEFNTCGTIVVEKISNGGVGTFDFTSATLPDNSFSLETLSEGVAVTTTYNDLEPGSYDVAEVEANLLPFWELSSATCTDGDTQMDPSSIVLGEKGLVTCTFTNTYTPPDPLTVSKTASGSYDRTITWELEKTVSPDVQTGKVGQDAGTSTWSITATKSAVEDNYQVTGEIKIENTNDLAIEFTVSDTLSDTTSANVTCPGTNDNTGTVPANDSIVCDYTASPSDDLATSNEVEVTATLLGVDVSNTASQDVDWSVNVIGDETVTLDDPHVEYTSDISDSAVETFEETFPCPSTGEATYVDGIYEYTVTNTATLTGPNTDLSDDAVVTVTCSLQDPLRVSKTASGSYDRTVTWELEKSVNPTTLSGLAGESAGSVTWTVEATKTVVEDNYQVSGIITIANDNAIPVDFSVSDALSDGTQASVDCPTTVPANDSVDCSYTASPSDGSATQNTVTVTSSTDGVLGDTAVAAVSFSVIATGDESGTLADARFEYSTSIEESFTKTFEEDFLCPAEGNYVSGKLQLQEKNVATLAVNGGLEASAIVNITCTEPPPPPPPPPPTSTLGDLVWQDIDGDGVQDPGEPGIAGVTVTLYDSNGNLIATQVTDVNGNYLFTGLQPGTYIVEFELPDLPNLENESFTGFKTGFNPALDSDVDLNGFTATIVVGAGENNLTIDAGVINVVISGVTVTAPPPVEAETLPFTGFESRMLVWIGLLVMTGGVLLLTGNPKQGRHENAAVYQGMSWNNH